MSRPLWSRNDERVLGLDAPVRNDPLKSQVFEIIKDAVFAGKMKPGEVLRELHLAKTLGVSQTTVREALTQLEHAGLVTRLANRGTTVTKLSGAEVRDRLRVRLVLEELAIADACERATERDFAALETATHAITQAIEAGAHFELGQADLEFHRRVWALSGSPVLYRTLDLSTTPLFAFLGVVQKMSTVSLSDTQPHAVLVEALRTRDPEASRQAIRDHIMRSYSKIIDASAEEANDLLSRAMEM